jgi:hypothetical protein
MYILILLFIIIIIILRVWGALRRSQEPQSQSVPGTPQSSASHGEPADGDGSWPGFRADGSESIDSGDDEVRPEQDLFETTSVSLNIDATQSLA